MINLQDINKDSWKDLLHANSPNDTETIAFLHAHEEEILDLLLGGSKEMSLDEKRREYIRGVLADSSYTENVDEIIGKICEIQKQEGYSILQFGKRLPGSSYVVFEFGDKVIKLGEYYRVLKDPNILQPEMQLRFWDDHCMSVYERVDEVFKSEDKDIAQEMYNRLRENGILWLDVLGYNVGRTKHRRDENDDGLRVIDAQDMEYISSILAKIDPERNEKYKDMGLAKYSQALKDYILEHYTYEREKAYLEMKEKQGTIHTLQGILQSDDVKESHFKSIKSFFKRVFTSKRKNAKHAKHAKQNESENIK